MDKIHEVDEILDLLDILRDMHKEKTKLREWYLRNKNHEVFELDWEGVLRNDLIAQQDIYRLSMLIHYFDAYADMNVYK